MIAAPELPGWAAIAVGTLTVAGAGFALIGSVGLIRFRSFYDRLHPPTMGSSMAMLLTVMASILCFSVLGSRLSVHEMLIALFVTLTTPLTFMLLARAALYRDRIEGEPGKGAGPADETPPPPGSRPRDLSEP